MNNKIQLSIIIPAYNEASNLKSSVLEQVNDYLQKQKLSYEVIIVDDGSRDETVNLVKEKIRKLSNFRLIENDHGGKALAVMVGMIEASGEVALFTDMDQATPISEIEKLLPKFDEGFDIVIGSRHGREGAPIIRKIMAAVFANVRNVILGLPFKDTQCGFKAFNRESRNLVFGKLLERWNKVRAKGAAVNAGFDVETLFLAKKMNFKIAEVGVFWHYVGTERVQMIKDSLDAIEDMLRIRWNDILGKYS